jgi:PD-(D/E)XK nuclease superfamily protein/uncharacterized protein DUF2357
MASPPTSSSLRFVDPGGDELPAPLEWRGCRVVVALPVDDAWTALRLERDDGELPLSLRVVSGERRIVADWPQSGVGSYRLRLVHADGRDEVGVWRVESSKIDGGAYAELLLDLESRLPASIVLALKRLGALAGVQVRAPGAKALGEELAKLRRAIDGTALRPGLTGILTEVARDPHRTLTDSEVWVARDRARRVRPTRLTQAVARPGNVDRAGLPLRLPEARVRESADVYENRLLKTFSEQVGLRLGRLESTLRRRPAAKVRENALAECRGLRERLGPALREARFLKEVEPLGHVPDRLTMVLLKRTEYRSALEGLLELRRRTGIRLEEPSLDAPLEQLPRLYETWGKLQTLDTLLSLSAEMGFEHRHQEIVGHEPGGLFVKVLPANRPALKLRRDADGTEVRLIPGCRYEEGGSPYGSVSFRQEPDVAIEIERPGKPTEVCLFDPKYKLASGGDAGGKPKKADIDAMHAYRDAIRDGDGRRVIRHASILYPGPSRRFGEGLSAISAVPGATEDLRSELRDALAPALASY